MEFEVWNLSIRELWFFVFLLFGTLVYWFLEPWIFGLLEVSKVWFFGLLELWFIGFWSFGTLDFWFVGLRVTMYRQ